MKKAIILCLLCTVFVCNSQNKEYDIHILLNETIDTKVVKTKNDSVIYQVFTLKEQLINQYVTYVIRENKLQAKIKISGKNRLTLFRLSYTNVINNNPPLLVKRDKVKNILKYPKSFKNAKLEDIYNLLKEAKHIYIIETDAVYGYYVLKEVKLIEYAKL